jgi:predicted N-formylglutamate amidohydrolase
VVVTVEHGGNRVPDDVADLFAGHGGLLESHRGWDPGTLSLGRALAARLGAPLVAAEVTRLLVDLNRSPHNPRVFSEVTRGLPPGDRRALIETYHHPHWTRARAAVDTTLADVGRVLHLGIHSFTPTLDGRTRRPDVALLYDSANAAERALAAAWVEALGRAAPRVVGRNDPYRGRADGLTTALRRSHPADRYLGVEVEINQRHVRPDGRFPPWVAEDLLTSLRAVADVRGTAPPTSS